MLKRTVNTPIAPALYKKSGMLPLNGILSELIGKYTASIVIHLVGLIAVIFVLIINKHKIHFDKSIPLFLYS
ncbi:hypothetical protein ACT453_29600, partial [Bacillus sp. D-CC]